MRLQYARLKVDHGWVCRPTCDHFRNVHPVSFEQKQNLNEVENLYFHHAHQRGTKPYPLPSLVATTQNDQPSFTDSRMSPPQSSLSFRVGSSTLSRSHANPNFDSSYQEDSTSYDGPFFHSPTSEVPQPSSSTENHILGLGSLISMDVDVEGKRSPTSSSLSRTLSFPSQQYVTCNASGSADASSTSNSLTLGRGFSSAPGHPSSANYHSDATPGHSSSRHDLYNFGSSSTSSSSTLTYDSFWSSRSFRGSSGNVVPIADESSSQFKDFDSVGSTGLDLNDSGTNKVGIHAGRWNNGKSGYEA
jgi:hypothetical protein